MNAFDAKQKKRPRVGTASPRERSEDFFNREDSGSSGRRAHEDYKPRRSDGRDSEGGSFYARDKRPRISRPAAPGSGNGHDRDSNRRDDGAAPRRSFNPNFTKDNRRRDDSREGDSRPYRRDDNRDGGSRPYQRDDRPRRDDRSARPAGTKPWHKEGEKRGYDSRPRRDDDRSSRNGGGYNGGYDKGAGGYDRRRPGDDAGRFGRNDRKGAPRGAHREYTRENYPRFEAKVTGAIRLNRFIANSGICSRREADDFIQAGVVSVNGQVVTELGTKVMPGDEVRFNDEVIRGEKKVYIVMNKPKGFVTSLDDPHAEKTVMELVKNACDERVYPVGRLDKNSVGVLLITNDGELTRQLTHPSHKKKKIYQVSLDKALTRADMERIAEGIELEDGVIFADEIAYVGENKKEVGIEIHSGRNRIVRRIFESLGYSVQKLDRVYFAGLTKRGLKRGQWRFLTPREVSMLKGGEYE